MASKSDLIVQAATCAITGLRGDLWRGSGSVASLVSRCLSTTGWTGLRAFTAMSARCHRIP